MFSGAALPAPTLWILLWFVALAAAKILLRRAPRHVGVWADLGRRTLIPFAALLTGAVSPRLMGLTLIDWKTSLSLGIGLMAGFAVLFALVRMGQPAPTRELRPGLPLRIVHSGAAEFAWCFLRAAVWESILLSGQTLTLPAYWATWGAALLILPDLLPQWDHTPARLVRVAILIATSVLYIYTRNFWLCWILHALLALMFVGVPLTRTPQTQAAQVHDRV